MTDDPDTEAIRTILHALENTGTGRNRLRLVLWNRDDAFPDRTLVESMIPEMLAGELVEVLRDAQRYRALVGMAKEIMGTEDR